MSSNPRAKGEASPDLADIVRIQSKQIDTLMASMDAQRRMFDMLVARAPEIAPQNSPIPPLPRQFETPTGPVFGELWSRYIDSMASKKWLLSMRSMMKRVLYHFAPSLCVRGSRRGRRSAVRTEGPDILISALRPYHWSDFRDRLKRLEPSLTVGSRNMMLQRMKAFLNWGVDEGRIAANPWARVRTETGRPKRETTMSDADLERIESPIVLAYLLTIVDSGMRPGEARKVRRDQFDLDGRTTLSWTNTKGQKTRPAWVTPRVLAAYENVPKVTGNPFVFASPRGDQPYSGARLWQLTRAELDRIGMPAALGDGKAHPHDGRRTFASRLNRKNISINKIQIMLGHSDIKTTQGYLSVDESDLLEAHLQLDAAQRKPPRAILPPKPGEK